MNIHRALADVAEIRAQLQRIESYQGFRSTAVGLSVLFLGVGAALDRFFNSDHSPQLSLFIWFSVAALSALTAASEMTIRANKVGEQSRNVWKLHKGLFTAVIPCLAVGAVITLWICRDSFPVDRYSPSIWNRLPALWMLCYGLGLANARQLLPRFSGWSALYLCGMGSIFLLGSIDFPWYLQMIIGFGGGHSILSLCLHFNRQRYDQEMSS